MNYDAIILSHPKDYNKIKFCQQSLKYLDPQPENIYLVTPSKLNIDGLIPISDEESIEIHVSSIKYTRPNWIFQQLVKLYQNFTKNDIYMCVDSDVIFNRQIHFAGKTFFISDRHQHHDPYFNFMSAYFAITEWANHTFINDFMIFDRSICKVMMPNISTFVKDLNLYLKSENFLFSEFETYGNFVMNHFRSSYTIRNTKTKTLGKYGTWEDDELVILMSLCKDLPIDLFTAHTWT